MKNYIKNVWRALTGQERKEEVNCFYKVKLIGSFYNDDDLLHFRKNVEFKYYDSNSNNFVVLDNNRAQSTYIGSFSEAFSIFASMESLLTTKFKGEVILSSCVMGNKFNPLKQEKLLTRTMDI